MIPDDAILATLAARVGARISGRRGVLVVAPPEFWPLEVAEATCVHAHGSSGYLRVGSISELPDALAQQTPVLVTLASPAELARLIGCAETGTCLDTPMPPVSPCWSVMRTASSHPAGSTCGWITET